MSGIARTAFLRSGAGGILAAALPSLGKADAARDLVKLTLTAAPFTFVPVAGSAFGALAYNGSVPGPLIRVALGQRVRILFRNRSGGPCSVHWHGQILPNAMDGVAGITQPAVADGHDFLYEFTPGPPGTRFYHDHAMSLRMNIMRGLFGLFIIDDPRALPADAEFALVFHDVPDLASIERATKGTSGAPMADPPGSPELRQMRADDKMGDEVAYVAHCVNGAAYPQTKRLAVKVGQRVRLRVLNANMTQTRYVRLAGHRLTVTHSDGNPLPQTVEVDALRLGIAERYDALFEVREPGSWLLQGISSDPLAYQQAVVVHTEGMERAAPQASPESLEGVDYFTYEKAGGMADAPFDHSGATIVKDFEIGGGDYGSGRWTLNEKAWPETEKIAVRDGDRVVVRFTNKTDMDHPMHLHGHVFEIVEIDGRALQRPLPKDVALVRANGGTLTWRFNATSPAGRWLLHCHNEIHMMGGLMTEVVYEG